MTRERDETHPDFLTEQQNVLIALVRERMISTHNIDTACLLNIEILARIAVVQKIAVDEGLFPTLDRINGEFMDYAALVGEMIMAEDGTRH